MKRFHVKVAVRILEIYAVHAETEAEAIDNWGEGDLIHTCDSTSDSEVLSVKEE